MASLDILCSKIMKIEHKKIFCGPSKIVKNISWPINIWPKIFHDPHKIPQPSPPPTFLMYGP